MPKVWFDEEQAAHYDERCPDRFDPAVLEPTVDLLAELAGDGAALELGIGTGRVALPLSARGVPVHGIDLSPAMVAQLRAKPGSEAIGITVGDFARTRVPGRFRVAYLVFNTIMNLTTQDEQVACFGNVAEHLEPGGCFVLEVIVPTIRRLPSGERFHPFVVTPRHLGIDEIDVVTQASWSHHYFVDGDRVAVSSQPFRYVWPSELDLMARLAGLTFRERWGGWDRRPFTADSTDHVSVWQRPAA